MWILNYLRNSSRNSSGNLSGASARTQVWNKIGSCYNQVSQLYSHSLTDYNFNQTLLFPKKVWPWPQDKKTLCESFEFLAPPCRNHRGSPSIAYTCKMYNVYCTLYTYTLYTLSASAPMMSIRLHVLTITRWVIAHFPNSIQWSFILRSNTKLSRLRTCSTHTQYSNRFNLICFDLYFWNWQQ